MKFAIVEFIATQSVEVIPVNWLTPEEDICFWPPSKSNFSTLLKNMACPADKWAQYKVRVLGKAGTARQQILTNVVNVFTF